jgi:hypothetical protein
MGDNKRGRNPPLDILTETKSGLPAASLEMTFSSLAAAFSFLAGKSSNDTVGRSFEDQRSVIGMVPPFVM